MACYLPVQMIGLYNCRMAHLSKSWDDPTTDPPSRPVWEMHFYSFDTPFPDKCLCMFSQDWIWSQVCGNCSSYFKRNGLGPSHVLQPRWHTDCSDTGFQMGRVHHLLHRLSVCTLLLPGTSKVWSIEKDSFSFVGKRIFKKIRPSPRIFSFL